MSDLLNKIALTLKSIIVSSYGKRLVDGKCNFCQKEIEKGYCTCAESELINRYTRKAHNFIDSISYLVELYGEDSVNIRRNSVSTPLNFTGMQFKDYKVENQSQKNALRQIKIYNDGALANLLFGKNLFLIGNYGTGKTMLMSILAKNIAGETLANVLFVNAVDLMNEIKNAFNPSVKQTALDVADKYKKAHFLFFDDIDKINPTEYVKELLYSVVNYRTEHELPTITSANHNLEELEGLFGEATVSRLANKDKTYVVQFKHKNWRVE